MKEINQKELEKNDKIMRRLVRDSTYSPCSHETLLVAFCLKNQKQIDPLNKYSFVIDFEYEVEPGYTNFGKGDLILTDGNKNYLVVEFKYINHNVSGRTAQTKRTKDRKKVREQAYDYANILLQKYSKTNVDYCYVTNETLDWKLREKFTKFVLKKQEEWSKRESNLFP